MDLGECYRKGFIKKTMTDLNLIRSLIEMSNIKEMTVKEAAINETNIFVYISVAYDSLREILEAVCIINGYKVTSHQCVGELLKSLNKDFNLIEFDRFRYIRNGINYYGAKIDYAQGKEIIKKIFAFKKEVFKTSLNEFKR